MKKIILLILLTLYSVQSYSTPFQTFHIKGKTPEEINLKLEILNILGSCVSQGYFVKYGTLYMCVHMKKLPDDYKK